jgi:hypothetical protein
MVARKSTTQEPSLFDTKPTYVTPCPRQMIELRGVVEGLMRDIAQTLVNARIAEGDHEQDPCPTRAHALGQGALGAELHFQLACEILAFELLVLADVGRDHLADLLGAQQLADALGVDAGVVAGESQVLDPAVTHRIEQPLWQAAQAETAARDQQAIA